MFGGSSRGWHVGGDLDKMVWDPQTRFGKVLSLVLF